MDQPSPYRNNVNLQDPIGKFVGKRTSAPNALNTAHSSKAWARSWYRAAAASCPPKGVYRFNSHEEADQWLWKMITRRPAN